MEWLKSIVGFFNKSAAAPPSEKKLERFCKDIRDNKIKKVSAFIKKYPAYTDNICDRYGRTPLSLAAEHSSVELARFFIDRGADMMQTGYKGETLLHVSAAWGNSEMTTFFLEQGLDVMAVTIDKETPLHCAGVNLNAKTAKILLDHGADPDAKNIKGQTVEDFVLARRRRITPANQCGSTYEAMEALMDLECVRSVQAVIKEHRATCEEKKKQEETTRLKTEDVLTNGVVPDASLRIKIKLKKG